MWPDHPFLSPHRCSSAWCKAMSDETTDVDPFATVEVPEGVCEPDPHETNDQAGSVTGAGSSGLEVRCPSCHQPTVVASDTVLTDLTCSACGSHFSLVNQSQATQMAPTLTKLGRFEVIERLGI